MRFLLLLLIPALSFAQNGLVTIKLKGGSSGVSGWGLNGNSIVDSNFLGTTNSKDLVFKTKNTEAMRIDTNRNIYLTANARFYNVDSSMRIYTGDLTGNAKGLKLWQDDNSFEVFEMVGGVYNSLFQYSANGNISDVSLGIGITPTAKLHVVGTTRLEGTPQSTTSDSLLTIDGQGNVAWRTPYYYGFDTLTNGVDTVWTSDVTANSVILLTSNGLNGTSQTGHLDVPTISAGNYFVVNSLKLNTTIETGDQRKYYWFFIRKP